MDGVVFTSSAFRHGYTEDDFLELLAGRYWKIRSQQGLEGVHELLGRNFAGEYLHIVYRTLGDGSLRVFHIASMSPKQKRWFQRRKS